MVLDTQLRRVVDDTQVAEVLIVVVFEHHRIFAVRERGLRQRRAQSGGAFGGQLLDRSMAAVAQYNEGSLTAAIGASEALIVVRVTRNNSVRPHGGGLASRIDVGEHQ